MKRFTKKASMLVVAMLILGSVFVQAEKRYVFALGGFPKVGTVADPNWGTDWVDLRLNDIERILYIWPSGNSVAGVPAVGTGALGQTGYLAFTVANLGWWGCGYYVGPDSGTPTAEINLTDVSAAVNSGWTLNFSIRTDCASDIAVNLYGCSPDPTDPFITDRTVGNFKITKTNLPLAKRDKTQWVQFSIPLSDLQPLKDGVLTPSLKLSFVAPVKKQNYLTFSGGNDTGSFVAWDNVYLAKAGPAGVNEVKAERLDIQVAGNQLKVSNNESPVVIYSVSGARMLSSKLNVIDISSLTSGIYVVKAGNKVSKFNK